MASIRENAFLLLQGIHEDARGDTQKIVQTRKISSSLGLGEDEGAAAVNYLDGEGLVRVIGEVGNRISRTFITSSGVNAVENALHNPGIPTRYFPAVQNIINIQQNYAPIQQGNINSNLNYHHIKNYHSLNLPILAHELGKLLEVLRQEARTPEHFNALSNLATAEEAAKAGHESKACQALSGLKAAGGWVLGTAEKIAVPVAVAAIKNLAGL